MIDTPKDPTLSELRAAKTQMEQFIKTHAETAIATFQRTTGIQVTGIEMHLLVHDLGDSGLLSSVKTVRCEIDAKL